MRIRDQHQLLLVKVEIPARFVGTVVLWPIALNEKDIYVLRADVVPSVKYGVLRLRAPKLALLPVSLDGFTIVAIQAKFLVVRGTALS